MREEVDENDETQEMEPIRTRCIAIDHVPRYFRETYCRYCDERGHIDTGIRKASCGRYTPKGGEYDR